MKGKNTRTINPQPCVFVNIGRHCEVHQMIGNYMWDPATNKSFDIGVNRDSLMPLWWNGSEPLWITLTKAKRKVYMYYWPGECVEIQAPPTFPQSTTKSLRTKHVDVFEDQTRVWKMRVFVQDLSHGHVSLSFSLDSLTSDQTQTIS